MIKAIILDCGGVLIDKSGAPQLDVIAYMERFSKEYKIALLSNSDMEDSSDDLPIEVYLITPSALFFSRELHVRKPDPDIYKMCLEKMRLNAEECVFIDDMERNLIPAKGLGMKTILFTDLENMKIELEKLLSEA